MYDDCTQRRPQKHCSDRRNPFANLGSLPFASAESAPMPVIVNVRTVVVRSGIASFRTAAFRVPIASAVNAIRANG